MRKWALSRLQSDQSPESVIGQVTKFVQNRLVFAMALTRSSIIKKERLVKAFNFLIPVKNLKNYKFR